MASTEECVTLFGNAFQHWKLPSVPVSCAKALASAALGYVMILGSALLKVPQIARIVSLRSAEGLSRSMFAFEGLAYLSHAMYSYDIGLPFSAYGEAIILFSQNIALLLVMAWFKPPKLLQMVVELAVPVALVGALLAGILQGKALEALFSCQTMVMLNARLPQIVANWRSKSVGELSATTAAMTVMGAAIRVVTTLIQGGGRAMLLNYCLGLLLNAILLGQILHYRARGTAKKED